LKAYFSTKSAFSIIEVLIWIFVFSLGLVAIYSLLVTSLKVNDYNKNAIIGWNLAREQIELLRNIRDTNYETLSLWNRVDDATTFEMWKYYKIDQNMSSWHIDMDEITSFSRSNDEPTPDMDTYRLCFDADNRYVYCSSGVDLVETPFYRYVYLEQTSDNGVDVQWAITVTSQVIWYKRWYHDFDIKTIITDWRRI